MNRNTRNRNNNAGKEFGSVLSLSGTFIRGI
jgi:hypothetical protein